MIFKRKNVYYFLKYRLLKISPLRDFKRWQRKHSNGQFYEFYAEVEAKSLEKGGAHPSLGEKVVGVGFKKSGTDVFEMLKRRGVLPSDKVVDYGCGSLRIGQHFINYLQAGNYFGLDVTDHFYNIGKQLLPAELLTQKSPTLKLIQDKNLREIANYGIDFIFSSGVLIHVPPFELEAYFRNILLLMSSHTEVIVSIAVYKKTLQFSPLSWAYSTVFIKQQLLRIDPNLAVSFIELSDFTKQTAIGKLKIQRGYILIKNQIHNL